jgi:hypothetical protein
VHALRARENALVATVWEWQREHGTTESPLARIRLAVAAALERHLAGIPELARPKPDLHALNAAH